MPRRLRRLIILAVAALVVLLGAAVAVFAIRGSDEPPPPELSERPAGTATPASGTESWQVSSGGGTFVGYRVREEFVTFGVVDAVGRTNVVSGTVEVDGDRITAADLEADLGTLRSDESRRDDALRTRGIETARFPTARFRLGEPFALSRSAEQARGDLTLHGQTRPVRVTVRGQRLGADAIELVGSAPIEFGRFGIEPPSVAGFVTVRDEGRLEFRLRLRRQ
jgi:polyisoprenoid-binding protein YceI